jgi:sortase A
MKGVKRFSRPERNKRQRPTALMVERLMWALAIVCLLPYVTAWASRNYVSHTLLAETPVALTADLPSTNHSFAETKLDTTPYQDEAALENAPGVLRTDQSFWSPQRLTAFDRLRALVQPEPSGVLELPAQNTLVPVFPGATEINMTLGAGHLLDSATLDSDGNIALTAHRDGAFRVLKDIQHGDLLILNIKGQKRKYVVKRTRVVKPDQVEVLDETGTPTLTLITCYPFYFVGSAPERFVVQGELASTGDSIVTSHHRATETSGLVPERFAKPTFLKPVNRRIK